MAIKRMVCGVHCHPDDNETCNGYCKGYVENPAPMDIYQEIKIERCRQDKKIGGPQYDDLQSTAEFVQFIEDYAGWARMMASMGSPDKARRRLMQVAALAIAAIESIDRKADGHTIAPSA